MNKPASYYARLRRRKAPPKLRKRQDATLENANIRIKQHAPRSDAGILRVPELANEF